MFCLVTNVSKPKMIYWTGNIRLLQKFSSEIMLRLYHFFPIKIKVYIQKRVQSSQASDLQLNIQNETLYSQVINCADNKECLGLNIKELEPQKMRTFLNICENNILFIYQVIIIYSKSMWEQLLTLPSSVAWKLFLRYSPFNVEYLLCR